MPPHKWEVFLQLNMNNNEFALPTVEHFEKRKWDPFLTNEPESTDIAYSLSLGEAFSVASAIELHDEAALDSARGELAEIIAEDSFGTEISAEASIDTGIEAESEGEGNE